MTGNVTVTGRATLNNGITVAGNIAQTCIGTGITVGLTGPSVVNKFASGLAIRISTGEYSGDTDTSEGSVIRSDGFGSVFNSGLSVRDLPAADNNYALHISAPAKNYMRGNLGVGTSVPSRQLDVLGDSIIRGLLEVTGNITSSGTSHNFANNSIPASAIAGLPVTTQVLTQAAYDALATKDPSTLYLITG
jgi:hypothetical protein